MAKAKKTVFFCQNCGHEEAKWLGQCPVCKEWNTFVEEKKLPEKGSESGIRIKAEPISLSRIETKGGADPDRDGRVGPCTWRRDCEGISGAGRGRSWHWEIHPFTTSLPDFRGER